MYEVEGKVNSALEACVKLSLASGEEIEVVIDTGFTGDLALPQEVVQDLSLPIVTQTRCTLAGGVTYRADVAIAYIEWLGEICEARVIVMPAGHLIGTQLLEGTRLTIDYDERTVLIEKKSPE